MMQFFVVLIAVVDKDKQYLAMLRTKLPYPGDEYAFCVDPKNCQLSTTTVATTGSTAPPSATSGVTLSDFGQLYAISLEQALMEHFDKNIRKQGGLSDELLNNQAIAKKVRSIRVKNIESRGGSVQANLLVTANVEAACLAEFFNDLLKKSNNSICCFHDPKTAVDADDISIPLQGPVEVVDGFGYVPCLDPSQIVRRRRSLKLAGNINTTVDVANKNFDRHSYLQH